MDPIRARLAPLIAAAVVLVGTTSRADYAVDILSSDRYPQLADSWMYRINNQGLAAGYITLASSPGTYLPTSYSGGGQFSTFGVESAHSINAVTGLNDRGDAVGNLFDKDYNVTPYLERGGTVSPLNLPPEDYPYLYGINNHGVAYGAYFDPVDNAGKVFTATGDTVTTLALSAPGIHDFDSGSRLLTDSGLLGVIGYSEDGSTTKGFVYDFGSGTLRPLTMPDSFPNLDLLKFSRSGVLIGDLYSGDYSTSRVGFWNVDGSFRGFFDLPVGMNISGVRFNDLGEAIGLLNGQVMFYDGSTWGRRDVLGLGGYTLTSISDFNDLGEFVGLARNPSTSFEWGFVAQTVPEPGSLLLTAVGLLALVAFSRARGRWPISKPE